MALNYTPAQNYSPVPKKTGILSSIKTALSKPLPAGPTQGPSLASSAINALSKPLPQMPTGGKSLYSVANTPFPANSVSNNALTPKLANIDPKKASTVYGVGDSDITQSQAYEPLTYSPAPNYSPAPAKPVVQQTAALSSVSKPAPTVAPAPSPVSSAPSVDVAGAKARVAALRAQVDAVKSAQSQPFQPVNQPVAENPTQPMAAAFQDVSTPKAQPDTTLQDQLKALRGDYMKSLTISPEEQKAKDELAGLNERANAAINNVDTEGSSRGFTTGYATGLKGAFARAADSAKMPLEARIANLQAARAAQQQASQAAMGFAEKDLDRQQTIQQQNKAEQQQANEAKRTIVLEAIKNGATQQQLAQILSAATPEDAIKVAGSLLKAPVSKKDFITLGEGQVLIDPTTGKPVYSNPKADANKGSELLTPTEAKDLGVPYGTTREQAFGKSPTANMNVDQTKALGFANNATNANNIMTQLNFKPNYLAGELPTALKSDERQQFEQASRAFVNAILRRESGAAISDAEYQNAYKQYIPQPGEGDAVLQQKAAARDQAIQNLFASTGQNNDPLGLGFNSAPSMALNGSAKQIASAIKKVESGGNYNARGASGESGAYQFMPSSWKQWAGQYLGNPNAPMTPQNQDLVAEAHIQSLIDKGYNAQQIALIWNGGQPIAKKGVNQYGVPYDSGGYASKVLSALG